MPPECMAERPLPNPQMKAGTPIWYAGDHHMKRIERVFAPFFGVPTAATTELPRLAQLRKAHVPPAFYNVDPTGKGYQITIKPPLEDYPTGELLQDVTRMNAVLKCAVRLNPTQYFWVHRPFKKRPKGLELLYPSLRHSRRRRGASSRRRNNATKSI